MCLSGFKFTCNTNLRHPCEYKKVSYDLTHLRGAIAISHEISPLRGEIAIYHEISHLRGAIAISHEISLLRGESAIYHEISHLRRAIAISHEISPLRYCRPDRIEARKLDIGSHCGTAGGPQSGHVAVPQVTLNLVTLQCHR